MKDLTTIAYKEYWLKRFGDHKSIWYHENFFNPGRVFTHYQITFRQSIILRFKEIFRGDNWLLDYAISLDESHKEGLISGRAADVLFHLMFSNDEQNQNLGLNILHGNEYLSVFRGLSNYPKQTLADRKKRIKRNYTRWLEQHENYKALQKHDFYNIETMFDSDQTSRDRLYEIEGLRTVEQNLWTIDYLVSIQKANKKGVFSDKQTLFLITLLTSKNTEDVSFAVRLLKEERMVSIFKSLSESL